MIIMNTLAQIKQLNQILLNEMPEYQGQMNQFPEDEVSQRRLLRSLMNVRPPMLISEEFLRAQDRLLTEEVIEKGIVDAANLPVAGDSRLVLWQGDITRLKVDAIVNAANSQMLGCFVPCHGCIDNAIHSAAGLQLRQACNELMQTQGHEEAVGTAKITKAYNLPSRYVLHTVGPIISGSLREEDRALLADCYRSCFSLAAELELESIAFCCISTGEYRFPQQEAAEIAVQTVKEFLADSTSIKKVIFNVFKHEDFDIYQKLLGQN